MRCPRCETYCGHHDNYCRYCGLALHQSEQGLGLPVKRNGGVPAIRRQVAPAVTRGLVVLAMGALAEMAIRSLARRAVGSLPSLVAPRPKARRQQAKGDRSLPAPEGGYAVSETVVMRRLTLRR